MRVLVLRDFGDLVVEERREPVPAADEVVISLAAVGICGTDVHGYTGHNGRRVPGQIMGHEAAGTIDGRPVTFNPLLTCGHCDACLRGSQQHCASRRVIGVDPSIQAAFAERIAVPAANVVGLPDSVPLAHGALVEPLAVAFNAVARSGIGAGDRVVVIGGGPIGQSVVLAAAAVGASEVVVSEPNASRGALARSLGATVVDPTSTPLADQLDGPVDVVIDAVGINASLADALAVTRTGGTVVLVGMGTPKLELDAFAITTAERRLVGSFTYTADAFLTAAAWVGDHPDAAAPLISEIIALDAAPAAFARLAGPEPAAGKIIVDPRLSLS